jgi:hypothetical protein
MPEKQKIREFCPHCQKIQVVLAYIQEYPDHPTIPTRHSRDCTVCRNTWTINPQTGEVKS